jgi:hypothetical protein
MTEDELRALTDSEIYNARGFTDVVASMRREALEFYFGDPVGRLAPPEIEGRSTVVSTDVQDTIEWMLPSLLKIFTAGDDVVEFTPNGPEDEAGARQATEYINYLFRNHPDSFNLLYSWIKDGLLEKLGIAMVYWDSTPIEQNETYQGLSDAQMTMLLSDPDVRPIAHAVRYVEQQTEMPGMAPVDSAQPAEHDVTILRTTSRGRLCYASIAPDDFLLSPAATSINEPDLPFCGHKVRKSISDLRKAGYENVDELVSDMETMGWTDDARYRYADSRYEQEIYEPADPNARLVWLTECYIRCDYDGDGIAELRRVLRAGNHILENIEVDDHPYSTFCPVPITHRVIGLSVADLAIESQRIKTAVQRAVLDNFWLSVNKRMGVLDGQVNLDDVLDSRPGGVIRMKSLNALMPIEQSGIGGDAMGLLEYLESQKENRTGFTRYSQGVGADSLNKTATGINVITNRSDQRVELIARLFAESMKLLFRKTLALIIKHQDRKAVYRLRNQWIEVDPSEWRNNYDMEVSVGLGTGNKDQQVQHLMMLIQQMQQMLPLGITDPQKIANAASKLTQALGFKSPEQFFSEPDPNAPAMQMQQQMQQMQQQFAQQMQQMSMQIESLKADKSIDMRKADTDAFNAETNRLKVMGGAMTPDQVAIIAQQVVMQTLQSPDVLPPVNPVPMMPQSAPQPMPNPDQMGPMQ